MVLENLDFLVLPCPQTFVRTDDAATVEARLEAFFGELAIQCLEMLPQIKYVMVDVPPFKQCVARRGEVIEKDEAERLRSWYQWEGADVRLAGIEEWLSSVEGLNG